MRLPKHKRLIFLLLCGILSFFFVLLFYYDNKYQSPPPYGKNGILEIGENDLSHAPIFLIDGWLLTDSRATQLPTYIGEYSNLQRSDTTVPPHGMASYSLTLRYSGNRTMVSVNFPRLSTDYTILLNGKEISCGYGNASIMFSLLPHHDYTLTVRTTSSTGYYSGMYFPPMLGKPSVLLQIQNIQFFAYALAFFMPLVLAVFTFALWRRRSDFLAFWFGLLCCFYGLYVSGYFVYLFRLPFLPFSNFIEGFALYGLCFCVVRLTALAADMIQSKNFRFIQMVLLIIPILLLTLYLCIPVFPKAVILHGIVKDMYFIFTFCSVLFLFICAARHHGFEYGYILSGCMVFGVGLLLNLSFSNLFEPILFFWQFEWCGLFLVLLFGSMMAARNRRILLENAEFSHHLEQLVEERTAELAKLLAERKAFFSDMAHDLKAPLFATQGFIRAIRQNGTCVDGELLRYIDAVEQKQQEMTRRVQGLSVINQMDKIVSEKKLVSVQAFLKELYATHNGEAEVSSIHLLVNPPTADCSILVQTEKLDILFENLIYNAIRATPADGRIVISATIVGKCVHFTIADTGCGMSPEELSHIFSRFYVGEPNKDIGTGLGLYIVKSIVTEFGGEIYVSSQPGVGTEFTIELNLA